MKNTVNGVLWLPQSPLQIKGLWKNVSCPVPKKEKLNNKGLSTCSWEDKALMNETLSYSLVCDQSLQFPRFTENILISKKYALIKWVLRSYNWIPSSLQPVFIQCTVSFSCAAITTNYNQCHKNITFMQISWLCQVQERTAGWKWQQLLLALLQSPFRLVVSVCCRPPGFQFLRNINAIPLERGYQRHWGYFCWLQQVICGSLHLSCHSLLHCLWSFCHVPAWAKAINNNPSPTIVCSTYTHHIQINCRIVVASFAVHVTCTWSKRPWSQREMRTMKDLKF